MFKYMSVEPQPKGLYTNKTMVSLYHYINGNGETMATKYSESDLEFAQTQLTPREKLEIKAKTGNKNLSDAIRKAVLFFSKVHDYDGEGEDDE